MREQPPDAAFHLCAVDNEQNGGALPARIVPSQDVPIVEKKKKRAKKRMADQVGKRMAEHIVGARSLSWASATLSSGATAAAGAACTLQALARPVTEKKQAMEQAERIHRVRSSLWRGLPH